MGLKLTAQETLLRAEELGHRLFVREITEVEHEDGWTRGLGMQANCSCGWAERRSWRSRKAVNAALSWHLGQVVADDFERRELDRRNGR